MIHAVENRFDVFAVERGAEVVPRKLRAGGDGVRREIHLVAKVRMQRGDVKRLGAFVLELAVFYDRVVAEGENSVTAFVKVGALARLT